MNERRAIALWGRALAACPLRQREVLPRPPQVRLALREGLSRPHQVHLPPRKSLLTPLQVRPARRRHHLPSPPVRISPCNGHHRLGLPLLGRRESGQE